MAIFLLIVLIARIGGCGRMWCAELVQVRETQLKNIFKFQMNQLFATWHMPSSVVFSLHIAFAGG